MKQICSIIALLLILALHGEANAAQSMKTTSTTPTLTSLSLESNATTVNRGEIVQLSVIGTYSDHSTKAVDTNVTYLMSPAENVEINGSVLTALKDGNVTVQAKVGTVLSNTLNLNITWTVNGHTLPPEPDKAVNDATLLGIDANGNGVRDDVERRVYTTYKKAVERAVMMQAFKTEQAMLADPDLVKHAREWAKKDVKAMNCDAYLYLNKQKPFIKKMGETINEWQFNTEQRVKNYYKYDQALSGGVYSISDGTVQDCEFDVEKVLEEDK